MSRVDPPVVLAEDIVRFATAAIVAAAVHQQMLDDDDVSFDDDFSFEDMSQLRRLRDAYAIAIMDEDSDDESTHLSSDCSDVASQGSFGDFGWSSEEHAAACDHGPKKIAEAGAKKKVIISL
mmetsp:Transcript_103218/g.289171  ORF Transcript_103218/g.289171 Transcript_103218/m.289171 type:complete len:122 (+) Transcript_103218:83-448(+)